MASLFCNPSDPMGSVATIEAILSFLVETQGVALSPEAQRGKLFLLETVIASVAAVMRNLGYMTDDPDIPGGEI